MACVAVTSLMRTLELEFLQSNPCLILQDKQHIMSLHEKLGYLHKFLDKSEKKKDNNCEEKIREVVSKAEYDIEAEIVEIRQMLDPTSQVEKPWGQWRTQIKLRLRQRLNLRRFRRILQDVEQLREMIEIATDFQTQHYLEIPSSAAQSSSQHTSKSEDIMVGHAKEFEEFKGRLLGSSSNEPLQVMALVGMGGIGKTTFARRIYDDPTVKSHFDCRGWATMSQEHNKRRVLLELCHSTMPMCDDKNTQNDGDPAAQLRRNLLGHRYLIILDDIWTTEAWDDVKGCFPGEDENTGSRILLTTRLKEVADYADSGKLAHDMRFLDCNESWDLFYQKFLVKDSLDEGLETIGRNIVRKCQGLPLAIVLLSGHLSANIVIDEWKTVESMLNSLTNLDFSEQFSRILTLSYNNLPCHLKSCFLYLGVFQEDSEIEIKKVIRLWIAEGFIKEVSEKTLEEIGEVCLHELIDRSLIMISRRSNNGKIKTCKMHDILHDLCVSKANNEKLLWIRGGPDNEIYRDGYRWLAIKHSKILLFDGRCDCHSLLCFTTFLYYAFPGIENGSFKMLRVLDMTVGYTQCIVNGIMNLLLLRYLAIPSNRLLTSIPVSENKNLQTLIACEDINGNQELPHGIWELPQLRHIEFHRQLSIYDPEVVQVNLQTLYWLQSFQCTKGVFSMIPNVKELGIIAYQIRDHCCLDNLRCLNQLEKLKVEGTYSPIQLPTHVDAFPKHLKNITFSKTRMQWEAISIISMLPNLEVLKLKNHACLGQEWELTEEDGFQRLKLLLISVTDLKDWKADNVENPFPVLERLVLRNCFQLKEMPSWIDSIYTLKSIQLEHCYASLVHSARMIEEEQRELSGECGFEILEFHTQPDVEDQEYGVWIEARSLCIAWVEDPKYWIWIRDFKYEVANLRRIWWLDIIGTVDTKCLPRMTSYSAYFVFKLTMRTQGLDTTLASVIYLKDKKSNSDDNPSCEVCIAKRRVPGDSGQFPSSLFDGWMEIKLGDFYVSSGNEGEVEMRIWNTDTSILKSGLIVKGIGVRPN